MIDPARVSAYPHGLRRGLQMVDAVASGVFQAIEPSALGVTEDRYVRTLLPAAYRHRGKLRSYGVKTYPPEADQVIQAAPGVFAWLTEAS